MWGRMDDNHHNAKQDPMNKKCSKNNKSSYISFFTAPNLTPKDKTDIQLLYQGNDDERTENGPKMGMD